MHDQHRTSAINHAQRVTLLRACPYWEPLDAAGLDVLADAVQERHYPAGAHLFGEGDDVGTAALHTVASGSIRIYKLSADGREQTLRLFNPGDTFADVPAFDGGGYPAHAGAMADSVVLLLPRLRLLQLMQLHPNIALGALQVMAGRLRHMTGLVEDLSLRRVSSRVARLLVRQPVAATLSQGQIATMVGSAREMVNRSLRSLADAGVIQLHGGDIVILDHERLSDLAEQG